MATALTSVDAVTDAAGNIVSLTLSGTSDECPGGTLSIQVFDLNSGDLIAFGNAPLAGNNWTKTLTVPDDIAGDVVSCGQDLQVSLACRQNNVTTQLNVSPDTLPITCTSTPCSITIDSLVTGVPSQGATGVDQLTITGTASCSSVRVDAVNSSLGEGVTMDVVVSNGQWTADFIQGDPGVLTKLKAYDCNERIPITVTCINDPQCNTIRTLPISCGGDIDCTVNVRIRVTATPSGQRFRDPNLICDEAPDGDYELQVRGPTGSVLTVISWTRTDSVTGTPTTLQDAAGNNITTNPLPVNINYAANEASSFTYTALVRDEQGCIGVASATFSCGGVPQPGQPVDCVVSRFSRWGPCINGQQTRTREVLVQPQNGGRRCPPLVESRPCPPTVVDCEVEFTEWSECEDGEQHRTGTIVVQPQNGGEECPELEQTRDCRPPPPPPCDLCCIWNWINIVLFILAAIAVVVAICMLEAAAVTAIIAIASGGTLAAVWAALTALNVALLLIAAALLIVSLISWIVWLIVCVPNNPNACSMLETLMIALSAITLISLIVAAILAILQQWVCVAGALFDVAWFGTLLAITTAIYTAIGCFDDD